MDQFFLSFWIPPLVFALVFASLMPRPRDCPECGERLSIWSNPFRRSRRMWWEGGFRCPNCDCETDLQGRKIAAGTPPRPGAVRNRILMLAFSVASTIAFIILSFALTRPVIAPPPAPFVPAPAFVAPVPVAQASPPLPPPVVQVDH